MKTPFQKALGPFFKLGNAGLVLVALLLIAAVTAPSWLSSGPIGVAIAVLGAIYAFVLVVALIVSMTKQKRNG